MIAPVIQAASNCSWVSALVIGFLCAVILCGMQSLHAGAVKTKLFLGIQWLWMLLIVSEFLHWIMLCWPNYGNYHVAPLLVLALAAYSLGKGRESACRVAGVLFWVVALLLGAVLFSGLREIEPENLKPRWKMQTAYYVVVMLIPAMAPEKESDTIQWKNAIFGTLVSVITTGVLSLAYIEKTKAPFYEMARAMSILGTAERFESLVAAGMTLGYFVLITLLLRSTANAWENRKNRKVGIWVSAAFIALVFISGMRMNSRLLAVGTVLVWVVLPVLEKIARNIKKPIDK